MGKATQKSAPVSLGTKRSCPDCSTKFYDFNKDDLTCPKCRAKLDPQKLNAPAAIPKRSKKDNTEEALMESEDIVVAGSEEAFESVEDLDDEDDVTDVNVDTEEEEGDY